MMKRTLVGPLFSAFFSLLLAGLACAADNANKSSKTLEITKTIPKLEVRDSQIGPRDTLLFYTFKDQNAVLKLQIDNKDTSFPMTGTIYVFEDGVKENDLKKWLNNQHSDGLYPEVPAPIGTHKIPQTTFTIKTHKLIDHSKQLFGEFDNYSVTFEVKDYSEQKGITLKGFTDTTKVHVKTK